MTRDEAGKGGMSARTARLIEATIIWLCIATLVAIFQPFSKLLSGIGMGLVVFCGLAFNLVPLCEPGRPARDLLRAALIVAIIFAVAFTLAVASAWLYGEHLRATR
jgi:xanthine/uracil permease